MLHLIPESVLALRRLVEDGEDEPSALEAAIRAAGEAVVTVVPDCVGLSVSIMQDGRAITLMATDTGTAELDAVQYLDGGPCVDAILDDTAVLVPDVLSEERWAMYARSAAHDGVLSSLSLPLRHGGVVVGGVNIYARTARAFDGRHDEVAAVFGAAAAEAVTNADLQVLTRLRALRAPEELREATEVCQAVGVLAAERRVGAEAARRLLEDAAARAGIDVAAAARMVLRLAIP